MEQHDFTFKRLSDDNGVFEGNVTHRSEVHWDEDAVLCHFGVDQFLSEGSSLPMILMKFVAWRGAYASGL